MEQAARSQRHQPLQGHTGGRAGLQGDLCLQHGEAWQTGFIFPFRSISLHEQGRILWLNTLFSRPYARFPRGLSSHGSPTESGQPRSKSALQEWRREALAAWPAAQPGCFWRFSLHRGFSPAPLALCARLLEAHASPTGHRHREHKPRAPGQEGSKVSCQETVPGMQSSYTGFPAAFLMGWDLSRESFAWHCQCVLCRKFNFTSKWIVCVCVGTYVCVCVCTQVKIY